HDGGDPVPDAGAEAGPDAQACSPWTNAGPFPPRWDGTDVWDLNPLTLLGGVGANFQSAKGYVAGWTLVVPNVDQLEFAFGPVLVQATQATLTANLVPIDENGHDLDRAAVETLDASRPPDGGPIPGAPATVRIVEGRIG